MVLDLSSIEVFEEDQIGFDKRVTFIFGKNGTGKTTIAEEMKKLTPGYDVMTFQGFANIINENKRLKSTAQLCLRWALQQGILPLPKSITPARIVENTNIFDFTISPDDMAAINALPNFGGSGLHPDKVDF